MKIKLLALALPPLLSLPAVAGDLWAGAGSTYAADPTGTLMSATYQEKYWKFGFQYFENYNQIVWDTTYTKRLTYEIEQHFTLAATHTILEYNFTDNSELFFDAGLAYTSKVDITNSSTFLFKFNVGYRYRDARIFFTHTSNAMLKGLNYGEDAIVFEWRF